MKANRKFLHGDDEAVSPVIAVILMVAITVVLAATVYVWVSGFGSNTNSAPAHTMSIVSAGAITGDDTTDSYAKTYTVSSADPSLTYGDLKLAIGGNEYTFDAADCTPTADAADERFWGACGGANVRTATSGVKAGDTISISCYDEAANCLEDKDLLFLDKEANSVMVTLKLR